MNELALFAGAGGGILGGHILGWRTVCAVEINAYCASVLVQRQNDGILPPFPIWDDVRTFDGYPWEGIVDVVSGGFPCQDISSAGKGAGITGEKSGLWVEMARIICEVRPRYVFVENSPMLTIRGLDRVLGDLSKMGYDARWGVIGAHHVGAPHYRDRIWIRAEIRNPNRKGKSTQPVNDEVARVQGNASDGNRAGLEIGESEPSDNGEKQPPAIRAAWWASEPKLDRVGHGVANRVDRIKAIGNGQVPAVAALAWETLGEG